MTNTTDTARVIIEVVAGLIPNQPDPTHTRRWAITTDEWHGRDAAGKTELLATRNGEAQGYAALLMLQPDRLNWVSIDWIWL